MYMPDKCQSVVSLSFGLLLRFRSCFALLYFVAHIALFASA